MSYSPIRVSDRSVILKLDRDFFLRPTLEVARDLIGKYLVYESPEGTLGVRLVEVEAYIGESDPACHAAVGRTERNQVMYETGGFSYVYFIYGMYYCLNVVTEAAGFPAAVLIRGAEPVSGIEIMRRRFNNPATNKLTDGPGKICQALGLDRRHNGLDLTLAPLYLENRGYKPHKILSSPRIGIKKGTDKHWRFYEEGAACVSVRKTK